MGFVHLSVSARNAAADGIAALVNAGGTAGTIAIYAADGDGIPATADTAVTDQTLLGALEFSDPAFGAASSGTITASEITGDADADATGTAAWARISDSNSVVVLDIDVGATGSGATLEINTTSIVVNGTIDVTACIFTMPSGV